MKRRSWIGKSGRIGILLGLFLLLGLFILGCLGGGGKEETPAAQSPSGSPSATTPAGTAGGTGGAPAAGPAAGAGTPTGGMGGPAGGAAGPTGGMGGPAGGTVGPTGGTATPGPGPGPGGPPPLAEAPLPEARPPAPKVPKDPVELAVLLKNKRKMDYAAASARKGVQRKPQSARAHYVLAWILVHVGKRTEATREFNKALQLKLGGKDRQEAESALQRLKSSGSPPGAPQGSPGGPPGPGGTGR